MSNPSNEHSEDRPTVVGIDPDMNIGDDAPSETEGAHDNTNAEEVDVEDLP